MELVNQTKHRPLHRVTTCRVFKCHNRWHGTGSCNKASKGL